MTIRRKNPRLQGLLGLSAAIDWFTRNGYIVAIPLNDSQPWDARPDSPEDSRGAELRDRDNWWWEKDSNLRRQSRGVYSAIPLATRASHPEAPW